MASKLNLFTVAGTGQTTTSTNNGHNFVLQVAQALNPTKWNIVPISYPATVPFNTSSAAGLVNLQTAKVLNPGPYVTVGFSQGAMVTSNDLKTNPPNLVAGVTFGNPMRQAGHTWPGGYNPGGQGIMTPSNLLTNTPNFWWDFAAPNDLAASIPNTVQGEWMTAIFMAACESWDGFTDALIFNTLAGAPLDIASILLQTLPYITPSLDDNTPHTSYAVWQPSSPAITTRQELLHMLLGAPLPPQNHPTAVQLAINYLNSLV